MVKLISAVICATLLASGVAAAADPSPEAEREASKRDWLKECVAAARQRDSSLTQEAATMTCKDTTGSGSATRAKMPGHSGEKKPGK